MTDHCDEHDRVSDSEVRQTIIMTQGHHKAINEIKSTLAATPDAETLRDIEHTHKNMPSAHVLTTLEEEYNDRAGRFRQITYGIVISVFAVVILAALTAMVQGISTAIPALMSQGIK